MKRRKVATRKLRAARIVSGLLAAVTAFGVGSAHARKKKPAGPPPDLPGHVAYLARQLYGLDIEDAKPITDQIQKLVISHMNAWMVNRSPNIVEVRHELDRVFAKLQYPAVAISSSFRASSKIAMLRMRMSFVPGPKNDSGWSGVPAYRSSAPMSFRSCSKMFSFE